MYLKEKNPNVKIIGAQPSEGSRIPGIRKWSPEYLPKIYDDTHVDELVYVSQQDAEDMCRRMAREEGILGGISSGANLHAALAVAARPEMAGKNIVTVVCSCGERYLSTPLFG
jgi:cysteine synthase B